MYYATASEKLAKEQIVDLLINGPSRYKIILPGVKRKIKQKKNNIFNVSLFFRNREKLDENFLYFFDVVRLSPTINEF